MRQRGGERGREREREIIYDGGYNDSVKYPQNPVLMICCEAFKPALHTPDKDKAGRSEKGLEERTRQERDRQQAKQKPSPPKSRNH